MIKLSIAEILEKADKAKGKQAKINVLREWGFGINNIPLFQLLKMHFEDVEWAIPPGLVEYKLSTFPDQYGHLYQNFKLIARHFLKDANPNLAPDRIKLLYVQFLENLDKDDAMLIESIRNGLMPYQTITKKLVQEAFPGLLKENEKA